MANSFDCSSLVVFNQFQEPNTIAAVADTLHDKLCSLDLDGDSLVSYILNMVRYEYLDILRKGDTWTTVYQLSNDGRYAREHFQNQVERCV